MRNESKNSDDDAPGPLAGERLAAARRSQEVSLRDIAKELHLDEYKVVALEENRFDDFGAPVFAKGHLRKYAELVGVPLDDLMADYYQLNRAVGAPPVVGPRRRQSHEFAAGSWLTGLFVVILIAAAAYWWFNREIGSAPASRPATSSVVTEAPPTDGNLAADSDILQPAAPDSVSGVAPGYEMSDPGEGELPESAEPEPTTAPSLEAPPDDLVEQGPEIPLPAASGDELALVLTFTGDCWTEVTDSDGNRLFFGLGTAGRTVPMTGSPPVRVLLGNSGNASLTVNGSDYVITAADRRGNTARLSINN